MDNHKIYGLIGYPLVHSFSRNYFNQKFEAEGIDAEYLNFEIDDIGHLMEVLSEYPQLAGLNVTIPYKEQVKPYLDEIDDDAAQIGAVNVIKIIRNGDDLKLKGFNSDVVGFCDSLKPLLQPCHTHALILGTGGAAKAVAHGLRSLGIEPHFVSRRKSAETFTYEELTRAIISEHTVIVNTTPLGMYPHMDECPDIPFRALSKNHICYDLIYNPAETLFLKNAREQGAVTKNGLEMLLLQAFKSYEIWNS